MISGIVLLEIELDTSEKIATKILFLLLRNSRITDQKRGLHHNSSIRISSLMATRSSSLMATNNEAR
jgi:hypothetical protein